MKRMVTMYYNEETGELTKVDFSAGFEVEDSLLRADVLQDAIDTLVAAYEPARERAFAGMARDCRRRSAHGAV